MAQQACNLRVRWQDRDQPASCLIHDRAGKFTAQFDAIMKSESTKVVLLPPPAPNMDIYAERWVQSLKHECLNHFIVLGERHLRYVVSHYLARYLTERPHQSKDNAPLPAGSPQGQNAGTIPPGSREGADRPRA